MISLLKEFTEVFTWSYEDMPGINPNIVQHRLLTYPGKKLDKAKALKNVSRME